jgi:hypothetical protein
MKKKLLTIGLLALAYSVQAQSTVLNVGNTDKFYISKNTLVYNGGSVRFVGSGQVENHGNVMVVGTGSDTFTTVTSTGIAKTPDADPTTGIYAPGATPNFINKLNEPTNFGLTNVPDFPLTVTIDESQRYTYGQLFVSGITQNGLQGYVDQEYRQFNHGAYQQIGMPFFNKAYSTLSTELGKTFTTGRGSQNDVLTWNNPNVVFDHVKNLSNTMVNPKTYVILGTAGGLNFQTGTKTFKGRPVAEESAASQLMQNAGANVTFGTGGGGYNQYNEKYYTYLQDGFHLATTGNTAWTGNYGKNIYQYSNPFMTNLDLSGLGFENVGGPDSDGDGNQLNNFYGVRLEVSGVTYSTAVGGNTASYKYVTRDSGSGKLTIGDVDYINVRPMGTFVLKFQNNGTVNPAQHTLNFQNLRRFNYLPRATATPYTVTAAKNGAASTTKQLTVIGLNAAGEELGRTYYVVSPEAATGNSSNSRMQVTAFSTNVVGTYEEDPAGGYDTNVWNNYWLYINEANESNFTGKNVKLAKYSADVVSYKFEVKENGVLIADNTHTLSSGIGFYFRPDNGALQEAKQGNTVAASQQFSDLYYGAPSSVVLGTNDTKKPSRTMVIFVPDINDYIVRFDPNWKKADITVYDMSGKLVLSKKDVKTDKDFVIDLDDNIKNGYIVNILSDNGEKVATKILK